MMFPLQYHWLKEFVAVGDDARAVARELTTYGASVERIRHVRHDWTKVIVVEITNIQPHPNADKLQLATVRLGDGEERVIVCGAPNITVGQRVPLALPGAVLPGDFTIAAREVRGVVSEGMLCSARELGIHDDHLGILVLGSDAPLGVPLESLGAAEDHIFEVEPTTNRPDVMSVVGLAREVSAILNLKLTEPKVRSLKKGKSSLRVSIEAKDRCHRFLAVTIDNITMRSTPWWMQERLARAGLRPINAVVDVTNYVMLELGQPLHAFDRQKIGDALTVRRASEGESFRALDGRDYTLRGDDLVVAAADGPVALAGIMGGEGSGVTAATTSIVLECATFEPVHIRRTARALQLSSDASQLFEKGLSQEAPPVALARAVALLVDIVGGDVGPLVDVQPKANRLPVVSFPVVLVERLLGITLPAKEIRTMLERLGFRVKGSGKLLTVTVPYWRDHDVATPEDLVEEVARLYGYHRFESILPPSRIEHATGDRRFSRVGFLRDTFRILGATETMSYSLLSESTIAAMRLPQAPLRVSNPLSQDMVCLRPSLLPSLVEAIERNIAERERLFLFEVGRVFLPGTGASGVDAYREERLHAGIVLSRAGEDATELVRLLKGSLDAFAERAGVSLEVRPSTDQSTLFAPHAAATVGVGGSIVGHFGILNARFAAALGVERLVAAAEFSLEPFLNGQATASFQPLPKFPPVKRDLSLVVPRALRYSELVEALKAATPLLTCIEVFDLYRGEHIAAEQQGVSLHLQFRADDATLTAEDVEAALAALKNALEPLGVTIRGES